MLDAGQVDAVDFFHYVKGDGNLRRRAGNGRIKADGKRSLVCAGEEAATVNCYQQIGGLAAGWGAEGGGYCAGWVKYGRPRHPGCHTNPHS